MLREMKCQELNIVYRSTSGSFVAAQQIYQWRIQDFPNGGALFCRKWGGAHPVFR